MTQPSPLTPEAAPHVFIQTIPSEALIALIRPFTLDLTESDNLVRMCWTEPWGDRTPPGQATDSKFFQFQLYLEETPPFVVFPSGGNLDDFVSEHCEHCPYFFDSLHFESDGMDVNANNGYIEGATIVGRVISPCGAHRDGINSVDECFEYPDEFADAANNDPEPIVLDGAPFMFSTTYRLGGWCQDSTPLRSTELLVAAKHHAGACLIDAEKDWENTPLFPDGQPPVRIAPDRLRRANPAPVFNVYGSNDICWGSQDSVLPHMGDCAAAMQLFLSSPCNTDLNSVNEVERNIECARHTQRWRPSADQNNGAIAIKGGGAVPAVALAIRDSSPAAYLQALAMGGIASGGIAVIPLMAKARHKTGSDTDDTINGWATFPDAAGLQWFIADQPAPTAVLSQMYRSSYAYGLSASGLLCGQVTDPDMLIIASP